MTLLARKGAHPLQAQPGVFYENLNSARLFDSGQVAFRADINGPDSFSDAGIWITGLSGNVRLIIRSDQQLEIAPGDFRTVIDVNLVDGGHNQVMFEARFTGGRGLFVATIPEPTTLGLLSVS